MFMPHRVQGVDGRDKPGHDGGGVDGDKPTTNPTARSLDPPAGISPPLIPAPNSHAILPPSSLNPGRHRWRPIAERGRGACRLWVRTRDRQEARNPPAGDQKPAAEP